MRFYDKVPPKGHQAVTRRRWLSKEEHQTLCSWLHTPGRDLSPRERDYSSVLSFVARNERFYRLRGRRSRERPWLCVVCAITYQVFPKSNKTIKQIWWVSLVQTVYLCLESQVTQPGRSHSGPPPPHPLPSTPCTRMDLMLLRASCAGWWIFEEYPSQSQTWPCEDSHSVSLPHAALPLCHSPWTPTCRAASAPSSVETSEATAETEKRRLTDAAAHRNESYYLKFIT